VKTLIKNGRVVDPSQDIDEVMDVLIEKDKVVALGRDLRVYDARIIDAAGMLVTPGLVDMHVHLREPGYEYKEDIQSGTRAAAAGGFTSVACMPNTNPVADNKIVIEYIKSRAARGCGVNVYPIGAITKGLEGRELASIGGMKKAGIVGISDDGKPVMNARIMENALRYAAMFDLPVISHCEDSNLTEGGMVNDGLVSTITGLKGIPSEAETVMASRDILLARRTKGRLHIAHVSAAMTVEVIRWAREIGIYVTAEAAPHHFSLTEDVLRDFNTNAKVNPPLRSKADVEAVIQGLKEGIIDVIATDHAPHALDDKDVEFDRADFGISGIETAVAVTLTYLVDAGKLSLKQAVEKLTINPAKILGIDRGTLRKGAIADVTIIDPRLKKKVDASAFLSKGKNTPFDGMELKGWPVLTIAAGKVIWCAGGLKEDVKIHAAV